MKITSRSILVIFLTLISIVVPALATGNWGKFKGDVVAKFLRDGRNIQLTEPFGYIDPAGQEWDVPAGTITNGASVPQFFWTVLPPFTGKYRSAAVIHDYYCETKAQSWQDTHKVFYYASRAAGVSETTAKAMYAAVYHFGPRWGIGARMRGLGAEAFKTRKQQEDFFKDLESWIARENPSLDAIGERLDSSPVPAGISSKARPRRLSPE